MSTSLSLLRDVSNRPTSPRYIQKIEDDQGEVNTTKDIQYIFDVSSEDIDKNSNKTMPTMVEAGRES
jgi:hypothetical protein